jgi:hypothetical protein
MDIDAIERLRHAIHAGAPASVLYDMARSIHHIVVEQPDDWGEALVKVGCLYPQDLETIRYMLTVTWRESPGVYMFSIEEDLTWWWCNNLCYKSPAQLRSMFELLLEVRPHEEIDFTEAISAYVFELGPTNEVDQGLLDVMLAFHYPEEGPWCAVASTDRLDIAMRLKAIEDPSVLKSTLIACILSTSVRMFYFLLDRHSNMEIEITNEELDIRSLLRCRHQGMLGVCRERRWGAFREGDAFVARAALSSGGKANLAILGEKWVWDVIDRLRDASEFTNLAAEGFYGFPEHVMLNTDWRLLNDPQIPPNFIEGLLKHNFAFFSWWVEKRDVGTGQTNLSFLTPRIARRYLAYSLAREEGLHANPGTRLSRFIRSWRTWKRIKIAVYPETERYNVNRIMLNNGCHLPF